MMQSDQLELQDRFEEQDLELSPGVVKYVERKVDLSSARTNEVKRDWAGDFLYVQELKGDLTVRLNNDSAPAITLREGDIIKARFQRVYLTNDAVAAWGTAVVLVGLGEFDLQPTSINRTPVVVYSATGTGAISLSTTEGRRFKLLRVTVHFNTAPTTSEDLTLTLNANAGAAYDTVLFSNDPSVESVTDLVYVPDGELVLEAGDELDAAFDNTDGRTYGIQIVVTPA